MEKAQQYLQIAQILGQHYFKTKISPRKNKIILALLLGSGGAVLLRNLLTKKPSRSIQQNEAPPRSTKPRVAVDKVFFRRLVKIIKIIIPSFQTWEFLHIIILTFLLLFRTVLSLKVADVTGFNAKSLVERRWKETVQGIILFTLIGIPASAVNAGLKYETSILALRFRKRLSQFVNENYLSGVNFYKASHLGGDNRIDNADQRVTADIEKFCEQLANLYTVIFKPLLDVLLFTYKLTGLVGWQGPALLFGYYAMAGFIKKFLLPSFGKLTAKESELEGDYRTAHQRLIVNAEEIAFYDGSSKEKTIINRLFNQIYQHTSYVLGLKGLIGIFDNFLVKYGTSITGYMILALPIYFTAKDAANSDVSDLTKSYVRNRQLLINLGAGTAQLVVLSTKVQSIAGLTARVAELLEMVNTLEKTGAKPFEIKPEENLIVDKENLDWEATQQWLEQWRLRKEKEREEFQEDTKPIITPSGGKIIRGKFIRFEKVNIVSPDGKLLVEDLTFDVQLRQNVMVTGPNGSGKSSLFRTLGELWPLYNGTMIKPRKEDILFVPQKPYLVLGTLRDQIIYPHSLQEMHNNNVTDEDLTKLLSIVDPSNAILGQWQFDETRDWFHAFSGGQKQRIAMARLFYHRPLFAILDECTSAVSDEVEGKIYETCKTLGITLFTVSHRPQLKKYHDYTLRFDGRGSWEWSPVTH
eukprot:TRINITY_DN5847_c0_g1_i4.p1 TRINITY_DN5847_c0_g1~~TRINITY_DN5847_c0_g1_i4.p1  ORF type:complete len:695 (-),score=231.46 TRINITY_DN5847_c0_g1_i4:90-2174(-)